MARGATVAMPIIPVPAVTPRVEAGRGGIGGDGEGGAIDNAQMGVLTINPELGAKKGSKQSKATDLVTGNQANSGAGGSGGGAGTATAGTGGMTGGQNGTPTPGGPGRCRYIGNRRGGRPRPGSRCHRQYPQHARYRKPCEHNRR